MEPRNSYLPPAQLLVFLESLFPIGHTDRCELLARAAAWYRTRLIFVDTITLDVRFALMLAQNY